MEHIKKHLGVFGKRTAPTADATADSSGAHTSDNQNDNNNILSSSLLATATPAASTEFGFGYGGVEEDDGYSLDVTDEHDEDEESSEVAAAAAMLLHRPIVVGYSFGPKKMSTMGVVMAEASKTRLTTNLPMQAPSEERPKKETSTAKDAALPERNDLSESSGDEREMLAQQQGETIRTANTLLTQEILTSFTAQGREGNIPRPRPLLLSSALRSNSHGNNINNSNNTAGALPTSVLFSVDQHEYAPSGGGGAGIISGGGAIVRHLRSSSPSNASSWASTGTRTASTVGSFRTSAASGSLKSYRSRGSGMPRATTTTDSSSRGRASLTGSQQQQRKRKYPIRVSFVPLDPEIPLEEQHGGIDVILHKLTEDILLLSQLSIQHAALKNILNIPKHNNYGGSESQPHAILQEMLDDGRLSESDVAAIRRVHRLCQFQKQHGCFLVDDPVRVQTLMSRADIAKVLEQCLSSVTSLSGRTVQSPKYAVVVTSTTTTTLETEESQQQQQEADTERIVRAVTEAQLQFPIIVKPLTAAGTKASHSMAVVTHPSGLSRIVNRIPCLLQEYANHDAQLYKVYVLGDFVSVHKRRSLPNLPTTRTITGGTTTTPTNDSAVVVEFDSQRPYPRLRDFGHAPELEEVALDGNASGNNTNAAAAVTTGTVTAEEVRPIANALKTAFGLEIFGFDILLASSSQDDDDEANEKRIGATTLASGDEEPLSTASSNNNSNNAKMLVVDVNYFPSYKEVPNFPALLAKFLTGRAIASRLERGGAS